MDARKNHISKTLINIRIEKNVTKQRLSSISEVVEGVDVSIESSLNVEPFINPLIKISPIHAQIEEENIPSNLSKK